MKTYLQRYCSGEYEQVWADLAHISSLKKGEPLYTDVLEVARETMRRVCFNIEMLLQKLPLIGYTFGYHWLNTEEDDFVSSQPALFMPPPYNISEHVEELESVAGPLPLSLRAWYETIGSVNFVGSAPKHWERMGCGGMDQWYAVAQSYFEENLTTKFYNCYPHLQNKDNSEIEWYALDPLQVIPLKQELEKYKYTNIVRNSFQKGNLIFSSVSISPDYNGKFNISGSEVPYNISLPSESSDALLLHEWNNTTFVDYLRICCRFGGLPGLQKCKILPQKDLSFLTHDLVPF